MQLFYKIIYHPTINPILLSILKLIPGLPKSLRFPPSGVMDLKLKNGNTIQLKTNQTCHVTSEVFWNGSSSYEYSDIFEKLFEKSKVFFDVGSNIGYYSIMAGRTNPSLLIYAFDPSPGPFQFLSDNVKLNQLKNVFPFQMALSNENGSFSFQVAINPKYTYLKYNSLGGGGHLAGLRPDASPVLVTVKAQTLDNFVSENNITGLDLVKLDVEEAEHLVLEGGAETLKKLRPIVVCEVFSTEMFHKIQGYWKGSDYLSFIFLDNKLKLEPYSEDIKISRIENYFFIPAEKRNWVSIYKA